MQHSASDIHWSKKMIVYGISTCSVCQKAHKALEAAGEKVTFRDVRADPLSEGELAALIVEFGDRLVDQTTNDYRALNSWLKNSEAEVQIAAKPKVMARPVIQHNDSYYLGWGEDVQKALLGS
ncbi:arsenate reductase-like glutaredoxin family protein [Sulfitobacter undariae]|uniref:Arsenate reductase-like glutaredoxin family protein n=2 Tax=Sulfitobacter undariae TaxID=1563671 RepID=A0A7W6E917_9RHOB|nr:arsenate reductase-like glutaredoxin family protein [Sulfitobacter undariae]